MTAKRWGAYLAVGALAYAGALLATLPASWVGHAMEALSEERLALRDPAGSAWAGSGRLYARQRSGELTDLGQLRWRAFPASILSGALHTELYIGKSARPIQLELGPASLAVADLDVEFPGAALAGLMPALDILGAQGRIRVRADKLQVDAHSVLGLAEVEWRQARVARARDLDLGSHVARLRGDGSKVDLEIGTLEGPVKLAGRGAWTHKGGLTVSGSAEPHGPKLTAFLKSVCAEYRDSRCSFRFPP